MFVSLRKWVSLFFFRHKHTSYWFNCFLHLLVDVVSKVQFFFFNVVWRWMWKLWKKSYGKNVGHLWMLWLWSFMMKVAQRLHFSVMIQDHSVSTPLLMGNLVHCNQMWWLFIVLSVTCDWFFFFMLLFNRFRLHIVDLDPSSVTTGGWLEDTSLVEKYTISEEDYAKRTGKFFFLLLRISVSEKTSLSMLVLLLWWYVIVFTLHCRQF